MEKKVSTRKNKTTKTVKRPLERVVIPPQIEMELPVGFIIEIDGIPFELTTTAKIKGHRDNFHITTLVMHCENTAAV